MSEPIIQVENLTKTFGQDTVLKCVTHDFERGKIHGIVGNNGSGNSTSGSSTSNTGTVSGTVIGTTMDSITIQGDDGNTYTINTSDANVSTTDGLYDGLYISANIDYSNSTSSGLYATSVTGH